MGTTVCDRLGDDGDGSVGSLVARVDRALDELAGVSFADLPLADQAAVAADVVRLRSRLEAVEAAALAAFDTGGEWTLDAHRSAAVALAHRCRLPRAEAHRRVHLARHLRHTPAIAAALAAGEITAEHARRLTAARRPGIEPEFDRDTDQLLDHARTLPFDDFVIVLRYWTDAADPDGAQQHAHHLEQQARAHLWRTPDDTVIIDAVLDPIGGTIVTTAVERIETELFNADWAQAAAVHGQATTQAHLARTPAQRRAAALVELAIRAGTTPPDGRRPRPTVNVIIDIHTFNTAIRQLAGLPAEPRPVGVPVQCELLDGPVITPHQAIELALDGHIRRVVYDTPNLITHISPRQRFYTGTLRDLLELRDRQCTHPGCHQPHWRCEADHLQPWNPDQPNTTPDNGTLKCKYHHRLRQRLTNPPTTTRQPDGTLTHHRPDGTPIPNPPRRWQLE